MLDFFITIFSQNPGLIVGGVILGFIGLVSQMSLYAKAGQPAIAALVPVWNVMVFCKVVGRPAAHAWFLIVPGLIMAGTVIAFFPLIDGLFPEYMADAGGWQAASHGLSEATVPFIIMGVASLPLIYFVIVMFTEVCDSFGKHGTVDKVMCVIFNGFYILFVLGISSAKYEAPWWARKRGLPYYMPDFKHKGKKYLVTPEGPMIGDPRDQKVKVAVVDINESEEVIEKIAEGADVEQAIKEAHINDAKPIEKVSEKPAEKVVEKVAEKKEIIKEETKEIKKDVEKKAAPKKTTPKSEPKLKADGTPMTWREEMAEKYKKKK
jgi:hypothetical protein